MDDSHDSQTLVLIVDDCYEDRLTYKRYLSRDLELSYEFVEAESGEEGLALAQQRPPDCILLDYQLPDTDGLEFITDSREEVVGKTPRILQGAKTERATLDVLRHAVENCQSARVELINYRKDGSEFWVELNIVPIANDFDERGHTLIMS